jgi:hypothetical protein
MASTTRLKLLKAEIARLRALAELSGCDEMAKAQLLTLAEEMSEYVDRLERAQGWSSCELPEASGRAGRLATAKKR